MNASTLKREIEMLLGLQGTQAASFWRIAATAGPAAASGYNAFPDFAGGVGVGSTATGADRHLTAGHKFTLSPPIPAPGPVPIPYPNFSAGAPVTVQGAGRRFAGDYVVTSVQHGVPGGSYKDDLIECVRAAAAGDAAAARARPIWVKVRLKLEFQPAPVRAALAHEITHTLQQRGGRP
jgi:hypothetical protein